MKITKENGIITIDGEGHTYIFPSERSKKSSDKDPLNIFFAEDKDKDDESVQVVVTGFSIIIDESLEPKIKIE